MMGNYDTGGGEGGAGGGAGEDDDDPGAAIIDSEWKVYNPQEQILKKKREKAKSSGAADQHEPEDLQRTGEVGGVPNRWSSWRT